MLYVSKPVSGTYPLQPVFNTLEAALKVIEELPIEYPSDIVMQFL